MLKVVVARRFEVGGGLSVARCPAADDDEGSHGFGAICGPVARHMGKASFRSRRDDAQGWLLQCLAQLHR
jgi:hypothetical protein